MGITKFSRRIVSQMIQRTSDRIVENISTPKHYQTLGLWISAIIAGLVAVSFAELFLFAEKIFRDIIQYNAFLPFFLTPVLFVLSWYLVKRYAPEASGSGIPQIMAANELEYNEENQPRVDRLLSLRTAGIKILSSLLAVLGGGAIGREGPTLQISTSVFHFFGGQVRKFIPTNESTWVIAGAAAGLASAFNTPLGGIVYAIEELGTVHFSKIRTPLISAVIVSGLVAQACLGSYLYLGLPELTAAGIGFMPIAILNGALTGICGASFGRLLLYLVEKRRAIKGWKTLTAVTVLCGLIVATFTFVDVRAAGSGTHLMTDFLFKHDTADLGLIAIRYAGTMAAYLTGCAGGIFSPSLAIGATIGSYLSTFVGSDHANLMVLLGMIGFLTGVTRTPFTSFILVLEMTDRHAAVFPMMLAALTAQSASLLIEPHSFYENMKHKYL
jgi:H+/Cl- antiporter ClcA